MDCEGWLAERPFRLDEDGVWLVERYLFGSLAIGASRLGADFTRALRVNNSYQAGALLKRLEDDDLSISFKSSAEQVAEEIERMANEQGRFWELGEVFVCTRVQKAETSRMVEQLSEYRENEGSKLGRDGNEMVKRRFFEVDSVFRHIRNAFAHGCFNTHEIHGEKAILLFDGKDGKVSAVASLRISRLRAWYGLFCELAEAEL